MASTTGASSTNCTAPIDATQLLPEGLENGGLHSRDGAQADPQVIWGM